MNLLLVTIFFQLLLFTYHQITTLVNLYPFNDVERYPLRYRLIESISNGIFMILPPVGSIFQIDWIMNKFTPIFYLILLVGMFFSWWTGYLIGPRAHWQQAYSRFYGRTIKILPPIRNNPIPDLNHCILHLIALITTILTLVTYFTTK